MIHSFTNIDLFRYRALTLDVTEIWSRKICLGRGPQQAFYAAGWPMSIYAYQWCMYDIWYGSSNRDCTGIRVPADYNSHEFKCSYARMFYVNCFSLFSNESMPHTNEISILYSWQISITLRDGCWYQYKLQRLKALTYIWQVPNMCSGLVTYPHH